MNGNGQPREDGPGEHVLRWSGRVVAADDLHRSLNGHRELLVEPAAVITPLALEQLRDRGVQIRRQAPEAAKTTRATWGYAQDRPHPLVKSAVQAVEREGFYWRELPPAESASSCRWAKAVAECVASGACQGGVVFCQDPGLVCCVANKVAGLRGVAVTTVAQAGRAVLTIGPNLVAVEMPGRTFFEIRQILRILCVAGQACPAGIACTLQELDGHAHR
ncbi:MAG TPA: RpiB/LacA/LacB family sugar-phosphate isomerase [Gemmataceae bacterium]|nr:RpiB/LacA/LacB family sugar-phosphate isomerase [Gemmataceae bacterium]